MPVIVILIVAIAVVGLAVLVAAVKIIRPYQRGLVERLGKFSRNRRKTVAIRGTAANYQQQNQQKPTRCVTNKRHRFWSVIG